MTELYIGLMSGTSLDGADGVLADFDPGQTGTVRIIAHAHRAFDPGLAGELLALNSPGENELHRAALAGNGLARHYAQVVADLCTRSATERSQIRAIGAHGQTVRHHPGEFDDTGYTLQLNAPALLAELCGIDVVADLRSRDVAAGGQGAPLVPAFHRAVFGQAGSTVGVLNIGGISNLTVLDGDGATSGFDCGPGNTLMDQWCRLHHGQPFDVAGAWAASGSVDQALLATLRAEPYFARPPPKSTGRETFHLPWLEERLRQFGVPCAAVDVQATLSELTAAVCAADVRARAPGAVELLVCGGGAYNLELMRRLATGLPGIAVVPSSRRGLAPDQVEACAFAWLARAFNRREAANVPAVTGAKGPRLLGALYPAR